jgi:hypothetical protein
VTTGNVWPWKMGKEYAIHHDQTVLVPLQYLFQILEELNDIRAKLAAAETELNRLQGQLARTWQ